jgi:Raf kinase inhibitor-like YbhB/YbcL family protein
MGRIKTWLFIPCGILSAACLAAGCSRKEKESEIIPNKGGQTMAIQITSGAFAEGAAIPAEHTCDGADASPPLKWSGVPAGAKSLALLCDDPDAPGKTWVHWVLYGLPPTVAELSEGVPKTETLPNGAKQGLNDFTRVGYGGPCPPHGSPHRYFFKLYALDTQLSLSARATKQDVESAMKGHVLAQGQLMGTYQRR